MTNKKIGVTNTDFFGELLRLNKSLIHYYAIQKTESCLFLEYNVWSLEPGLSRTGVPAPLKLQAIYLFSKQQSLSATHSRHQ